MTYLQNHPDFNNMVIYAAINDEMIETMSLCQTYDKYGQIIGHDMAGDFIDVISQAAADKANEAYNEHECNDEDDFEEKYKIGDTISAYDDSIAFEAIVGMGIEDVVVTEFECKGFTFWNGHNFNSIILGSDNPDFEGDWSIVTDEKLLRELDDAIKNMELIGTCHGVTSYKSEDGKWGIDDSAWQGTWAKYEIQLMENVETLANYPEYM